MDCLKYKDIVQRILQFAKVVGQIIETHRANSFGTPLHCLLSRTSKRLLLIRICECGLKHHNDAVSLLPFSGLLLQSLYECGDKDAKFVGSRQWIGSMELGYCLDNMLGIQSRIINTNSGAEVADNVRQLALHFDNSGTPVMIGKLLCGEVDRSWMDPHDVFAALR